MKGILKSPLIVAAVVVVLRVVAERTGAPPIVSNLLSVVALHTLLVPLYLAVRIGKSGVERPYSRLIKLIASYAVWTRAMILPTYWLARVYQWPETRFDGTWGPDVSAFVGFIAVPVLTGVFWIVASVVVGGLIGAAVVAVVRRNAVPSVSARQ